MSRFSLKRKQEIGLSPDELFFRGEKKIDKVNLRIINYNNSQLTECTVSTVKEAKLYQSNTSVTWFNIDGLHDENIMHNISKYLEVDEIVIADVMDTDARPTLLDHEDCIFVSVKMLKQINKNGNLIAENLSLILTDSILISFQERKGRVFEPIRKRIRSQKKRIKTSGVDYLLFALLDIVVDNYIYILSTLGDKIETLEGAILDDPKQDVLEDINNYKRELNFIRKNINPAKEVILGLSKLDSHLLTETNHIHFKELVDNINQATEATDSYRDILSDQLNIYHTTISSKLNDIMKFLTVFSVVFIPLTFIAGIYGTNFKNVPELGYEYSYFIMWAIMIVVASGMLLYFKRKNWL